jgi:predicted NAD/FAD-dependent oxidoreductase
VYVQAPEHFKLPQPMLSLQSNAAAPAQFVFDRGQMILTQSTPGLMAFVISASQDDKTTLEHKIMKQAQDLFRTLKFEVQGADDFSIVQTVIEKRATFACVPQLSRPHGKPSKGVSVCGDYVAGPYPATLEGAVLSGCEAGRRAAALEG